MLSLALVALLATVAPQRAGLPDGAALALVLALLAPAVAQAGIRLDLFRHRRRSRPAGRRSHKDIRR
ncbi:hypothetical protein [Frigidibacter oleivorans]|uniref:hypothetical protein n=1 Tax=Frigidibacter oleivorans TaxID=2487129 RepID=UPI000F8F3FE0|nr:hypothetical protein [Frigidibacter oleivorans]